MKEQVTQVLHKIKDGFGVPAFTNPKQFRAVLSDVPIETNAKKIRSLLTTAMVEMQVFSRLESAFEQNSLFIVDNLINEMSEDYEINHSSVKIVIEAIAEELFSYKPVSAPAPNVAPIPTPSQSPIPQSQEPIDADALKQQLLTEIMGQISADPQFSQQISPQPPPAQNCGISITPKIGSIIPFSGYEWRVLNVQNDKALILSDKIIETRAYHSAGGETTWAECELHDYLNGINNYQGKGFYDSLDKVRIAETKIITNRNPWFNTKGGNVVNDKVFLLSIEEVVQYFGDSGQLKNKNPKCEYRIDDQYNSARIAKDDSGQASWWWLRSPGDDSDYAAYVIDVGYLYLDGDYVRTDYGGVRPAFWLLL